MLRARAGLLADIRTFFRQAGVLEVETPVCSRFGVTDPAIESFTTRYTGPAAAHGETLYLHTSPEFPMKRLLAAGSGPIYQICKVFRGGELGTRHNPEFTLLEWYRPGFDHFALMDEVASLVNAVLPSALPVERLSYGEAFQRYLGIDPHAASFASLRQCAIDAGIPDAETLSLDGADAWLDLLLTQRIEFHLGRERLSFLFDYPASQAALAKVRQGTPAVAERFELYLEGIEIANGFHELTDAQEQQRRFEQENATREERGLPTVPMDRNLLSALASGMPECAGVALGIDRLLMRVTDVASIEEVLAFPYLRA
ncbi:MAG: EF-P lysine aminoacylase GenX [gamma proteobacterium endosymbiont of Lamellibrachia anaximandri]|nr:EF-P lysine aminoacylase GenX [gamma proteobacterium endosymbiont of Lamellibrachia anaximandri]MBL3534777.1 EF-P lysine aminoacylase GenX [gamma proteobacterium endosymbiont of Lamellibrachia anaximandri]